MKSVFFFTIVFIAHALLGIEPYRPAKDFGDHDLWIAAYSCNSSKLELYLSQRKPFSTEMLIANKLIESYAMYRCGNMKTRDAILEQIDELIETQYLEMRKLDYDAKKKR